MHIERITNNKAFTLIELILVIIISSILATISMRFIDFPVKAYMDIVNRQEVVNAADVVFNRLSRELRGALPNSVRVKPGQANVLEFLSVRAGFRYRKRGPGGGAAKLRIRRNDRSFNVFGLFPSDMLGNQGYRVVVYNLGSEGVNSDDPLAGQNAYSSSKAPTGFFPPTNSHVITDASNAVTLSNLATEGRVNFAVNHKYPFNSLAQRVYFVDTPVSYICDPVAGTITRYSGYSINDIQPSNPNLAPLVSATKSILAENIASCNFTYDRNVTANSGLVKAEIVIDSDNKTTRLFDQIRVSNVP